MNKYLVIIVMVISVTAGTSTSFAGRAFRVVRHDANDVEICVSNFGTLGQDETGMNPGCWWPIGTDHNYIYGAGVWFGTIDPATGDTLVSAGYMPHNGESELAPGLSGMSPNDTHAIVYIYPDPWPPYDPAFLPMAPLEALSNQDSWCCYNDSDAQWHQSGDVPIGLEFYQTVYVWSIPDLASVVWFFIDVNNVSGETLDNCYVAVAADCDIGHYDFDERCSGIVQKEYNIGGNYFAVDNIGYQWQEVEDPGTPPWFPGAIGFDLVQTPFDLVEGMDKDGDGILDQYERDSVYYVNNLPQYLWDVDFDGVPDWRDASENPQLEMTALKRFTPSFEPTSDPQRYMAMAGYDFQTGLYEPYDTVPVDPANVRFVMSSGPFEIGTDSVVTLGFAIFFADWGYIYSRPDTAIAYSSLELQYFYDMSWWWPGINEAVMSQISKCELRISPNPISHTGRISFSLATLSRVSLKLYNTLGQLVETVYDGFKPAGVHEFVVNTHGLPQGTYFLVLETPTIRQERSFVLVR